MDSSSIKLCECGCGEAVKRRFIHGHNKSGPPAQWVYTEEDRGHHTPCWVWQKSRNNKGYGFVGDNGKQRLAHRVSYEKVYGEIPEGLVLDHLCRVRSCINPDHLEPVTSRENLLRGKHIKLTDEQVEEIRRLAELGTMTQAAIGKMFGIHGSYVGQLAQGKWRIG